LGARGPCFGDLFPDPLVPEQPARPLPDRRRCSPGFAVSNPPAPRSPVFPAEPCGQTALLPKPCQWSPRPPETRCISTMTGAGLLPRPREWRILSDRNRRAAAGGPLHITRPIGEGIHRPPASLAPPMACRGADMPPSAPSHVPRRRRRGPLGSAAIRTGRSPRRVLPQPPAAACRRLPAGHGSPVPARASNRPAPDLVLLKAILGPTRSRPFGRPKGGIAPRPPKTATRENRTTTIAT